MGASERNDINMFKVAVAGNILKPYILPLQLEMFLSDWLISPKRVASSSFKTVEAKCHGMSYSKGWN